MGEPRVSPSYTPERISTPSASLRWVTSRLCPGRRRSRSGWMSAADSGSRGGHPSITTPTPGPCDSPNVVMRKRRPLLEPMAAKYASAAPTLRASNRRTADTAERRAPSGETSENTRPVLMRDPVRADGAAMSSTHAPGVTTFVTDASSSDPDEQEHVVDPVHTGPGDSGSQPWIRRFAVHCLLVLLALVGLVVVVDRGASVITDEGAVITQTAVIADGDWTRAETWRIDRPFAEIDPDADYVPLELSDIAGDSYLPYAKHPAYPVLLLPAWEAFGHRGTEIHLAGENSPTCSQQHVGGFGFVDETHGTRLNDSFGVQRIFVH